jgi:preprotein translocase subunit SecD
MKPKIKKLLTNWRIILLIILLLLAVTAIKPNFNTSGVSITYVESNSSANIAGLSSPPQNIQPRDREVIKSILGREVKDVSDYYEILDEISFMQPGNTVIINTNKKSYQLILKPEIFINVTNELETIVVNVTEEVYDENNETYVNKTIEKEITQNVTEETIMGVEDIGLQVKEAPFSNIRKGLDLEGGTRVILQTEEDLSAEDFEYLLNHMAQRLDVYGLSDIRPKPIYDLARERYILIEIPGASQEDVKSLVLQQGLFEAKIGNTTVFSGGDDIRTVMMTPEQSGIDPTAGCSPIDQDQWTCRFFFGIVLSQEAAERQAAVTEKLNVITIDEQGRALPRENQYLDGKLDFYLDGVLTESLNIGADLRGRAVTEIRITGPGQGRSQQEARNNALRDMKEMQTLLKTGSLPVNLIVIKTDTISPLLGQEFLKNALIMGFAVLISVITIIFIVYKKIQIVIPIALTMISELVLLLGFASAFRWSLDMAAIAGIIIVIGTGVDHLIIITDETMNKSLLGLTWLQKIKRAFSIIFIAGLTTLGAMIPLMFAGAGLLKGFAIITIVGMGIGVLIARPAYSAMIEILLNNKN